MVPLVAADCRAEVAELRETVAGLVLTAAAPPPPPDLRAAVLAAVVGVEQLPPAPGRARRAMPSDDAYDEPQAAAPVRVAPVADPEALELDEAVELVNAKAAAGGGKGRAKAKPAAAKGAAKPKAPAKPKAAKPKAAAKAAAKPRTTRAAPSAAPEDVDLIED